MESLTIKIKDSKNLNFLIELLSKFNFVAEVYKSNNDVNSKNLLKRTKTTKTKKIIDSNLSFETKQHIAFKFGAAKDLIKISDDFNEPLEEFNEYL